MKAFLATATAILLLAACSSHATYSHKKATPATNPAETAEDPVCGMKVNPKTSPREEYRGQMFYFCSEGCENEFKSSPAGYVRPPAIDMPVK
jgi:Cu+-exporting ATPase